jgi:hypothetical protein
MIIDTAFAASLLVSHALCWSSMKKFPKISKRYDMVVVMKMLEKIIFTRGELK